MNVSKVATYATASSNFSIEKSTKHDKFSSNTKFLSQSQDIIDKKKRRQERNRESARECRKRKKQRKQDLSDQLARLEADNLKLRLQLQAGNKLNKLEEKSHCLTEKLVSLLKVEGNEPELKTIIDELEQRYSDYGKERKSAIEFHMKQLKDSLEPAVTTQIILWLLQQSRKVFNKNEKLKVNNENKDICDIFEELVKELNLTENQLKAISTLIEDHESGDPFEEIEVTTLTMSRSLDAVQDSINKKNSDLDKEMEVIQSNFNPVQIAKFLIWVHKNPVYFQLLKAVWPDLTQQLGEEDELNDSEEFISRSVFASSDTEEIACK